MITSRINLLSVGATLALTLLGAPFAHAQALTSVTTSTGTISEFSPDTLVIQSRTERAPLRYRYTRSTAYVDETGAPVSMEVVRSGLPVTVQYERSGEELIANRVIVQRQVSSAPAPTVIERNTTITPPPQVIDRPVVVEKKVYVDRPVVVEKRVPVEVERKVYVDRPVVVEKQVPVDRPVVVERTAPAPRLIEEKTTTTVTTTKDGRK